MTLELLISVIVAFIAGVFAEKIVMDMKLNDIIKFIDQLDEEIRAEDEKKNKKEK